MCPVRRRNLLGQHRLEQAQGLAELHRPALELAENSEKLLSRALLQLLTDLFGRSTTQSLTESERRAAGEAERQGGKFCASATAAARCRSAPLVRLAGCSLRAPILYGSANRSHSRDELPSAAAVSRNRAS